MSTTSHDNPLLAAWPLVEGTPFPPFDRIEAAHFEPAFDTALAAHNAELDAIAANPAAATFANTAAAFDAAGALLKRVELVYENLTASESSEALRAVERTMSPRLAAHRSAVFRHTGVFARLDALHETRDTLGLDAQSLRLLERLHFDFVRAGAQLPPAAQQRLAAIVERLAALYTAFGQNALADEAGWSLPLHGEADLAGLPAFVRDAVAAAAQQRKVEADRVRGGEAVVGAVVLTRSVAIPFLTFSTRADLRETVWRAWVARGEGTLVPGTSSNRPLAEEMVALRTELAHLHGAKSFADYALADRMARTPQAAQGLLERVWTAALGKLDGDAALLREAGGLAADADIPAWDWRLLAERVRVQRFAIDDAEVKPYFALDRMVEAMFDCANKLFGLTFRELHGVPLYHPDARLWAVERAGQLVGHFIGDNFARPAKRGGAWMHVFRNQSARPGSAAATPIVINNNNFAKAPEGQPVLLGFGDVRTLFHEFGHGLHGLLSAAQWETLAGTNVLQDFVELPSQLFEHWALEPQVLKAHARHTVTGEPIPDALLAKLKAAARFNQAYETIQYTGSALLDLHLHRMESIPEGFDIAAFETETRAKLGVPASVDVMHRLPHFRHLFAGDSYAAGYYVYMWAEVLDADAFGAFKESGDVFHGETAERLLRHIYSAGNTVEPGATYRAFRGRDAAPEAMLVKRGLLAPDDAIAA